MTNFERWEEEARSSHKGWWPLLQPMLKLADEMGVEVVQVKEKFGTLRFYWTGYEGMPENARKELDLLVDSAEVLSSITCEWCGDFGKPMGGKPGWILTLCPTCIAKREQE